MDKLKILVIDDEVYDMEATQKLFVKAGFDVQVANSGEQGLEYLADNKVDAVLSDIVMQNMSGIDVLKQIRKKHGYLPVFLYTTYTNEKLFKEAEINNANGYLIHKDLNKSEIIFITNMIMIYYTETHRR